MSNSFKNKFAKIANKMKETAIPDKFSQFVKEKPSPDKLSLFVKDKPIENDFLEPKMEKVPSLLRLDKNNHQDYDPLVVSLGPYHHGKEELQLAENFKLLALKMFVVDSGRDLEFFLNKVLEKIIVDGSCYADYHITEFNAESFAIMFLLDATFIISFIMATRNDEDYVLVFNYLGDLVYGVIFRDILLLENQIPHSILQFLICLRYGEQEGGHLINNFLRQKLVKPGCIGSMVAAEDEEGQEKPLHLLAAARRILVREYTERKGKYGESSRGYKWKGLDDAHVDIEKSLYVGSFRSVMDLKAKGIHFRPRSPKSLKPMNFKPGYFYAQLEVPRWRISPYTKVILLNLIAYEMCPSTFTDRTVTAYVDFMKSLIDNPKDVKELREKKILFTTIGSDEEVVKMYKEIKTYDLNDKRLFHNVKAKIEAHYNNPAKTWLAELIFTYFRSPWTVIALFAATFLLVLAFLQTYFTIRPV